MAGGVALLLWGVRMVRTGITRAYGADLRRVIGAWSRRRLTAFAAGLGVTAILQSSTATSLMVSSFAGRGLIATVPALAVMLGANVGTTFVAQILAFKPWWLAPALLVLGVSLFLLTSGSRPRHLGRVAIGLGLMLVALEMTLDATAPLREAHILPTLMAGLAGSPPLAFLLAALLTWLAHSSLAVVLLVMSLASNHLVDPGLAIALVLGANIGGAVAPVVITAGSTAPARRAQLGNLLMRLVVALPLLLVLPELAGVLGLGDRRSGAPGGRRPYGLQSARGGRHAAAARSRGPALQPASCPTSRSRRTPGCRAIWTRTPSTRRPRRWPAPPARRSAWATS